LQKNLHVRRWRKPNCRRPKPDRRRALELLAASRDGCTEAMMLAHGFTIDMMVGLVNAGLATARAERVVDGAILISGADHGGGGGRFLARDKIHNERRRCR
jgi:hypothetical protein